jgi:hypothetical protein
MTFVLRKDAPVPYSKGERRLFDILAEKMEEPHSESVDTLVLTDLYYGRCKPFHSREALIRCLALLGRKIDANGEPFMVFRSVKCGPHSQRVRLVPCQRMLASYKE